MWAILASTLAGAGLALVLLLLTAADGSEALVTGSVLIAFGVGWGLMAFLTSRFSGQPQRWMPVPATVLVGGGLLLALLQPGPPIMDLLGWVWPIGLAVLGAWMFGHLRTDLRGRGRWLVGTLILVLLGFAVAGGLTTLGTNTSAAEPPGPGKLVDVGGRRLYLECAGTGSPAVILQAGAGGSSESWSRVRPGVSAMTTVCSYDRAGRGWSEAPPQPQDGEAIARDLHELLARAGVAGPYVLVGHSSGGPYQRVFAGLYPEDVAGLVLLDPQPADAFQSLPDYPSTYAILKLTAGLAPSLARIGLLGPLFGTSPSEASPAVARSVRDEYRMLPTALDQAARVTNIGDVPLVILSAGTGSQRGWAEAQVEQAALSSDSVQKVVTGATHDSLLDADSAAAVQAVIDVVRSVREGTTVG